MSNVRHRGTFHVLNRTSGSRFDRARRRLRCQCRLRRSRIARGVRTGKICIGSSLNIGGGLSIDGKSKRLHVKKSRWALRAKIAVDLQRRGYHVANLQARCGVRSADATHDDYIGLLLHDCNGRCMRRVHGTNAGFDQSSVRKLAKAFA